MSKMIDILEKELQVRTKRKKRKKVFYTILEESGNSQDSGRSDNSQVSKENSIDNVIDNISGMLFVLVVFGMYKFVNDILVSLGLENFGPLVFCTLIFILSMLYIVLYSLIYAFYCRR
ncbi:MAG: hypothetical protein RMJ67_08310 [Elusimicrobiota bacterium]|nr:hypothetical protein [Endomicrobiia bacterium]MDW8166498.1 hypothetical protein [Elusimicrobiota bacterium]